MLLKDSNGKKSLTATLSIVAFIIVMVKVLASGGAIEIGSFSYVFGSIDSLTVAAILGPILGTYAFRRHTDAVYGNEKLEPGKHSPEAA